MRSLDRPDDYRRLNPLCHVLQPRPRPRKQQPSRGGRWLRRARLPVPDFRSRTEPDPASGNRQDVRAADCPTVTDLHIAVFAQAVERAVAYAAGVLRSGAHRGRRCCDADLPLDVALVLRAIIELPGSARAPTRARVMLPDSRMRRHAQSVNNPYTRRTPLPRSSSMKSSSNKTR